MSILLRRSLLLCLLAMPSTARAQDAEPSRPQESRGAPVVVFCLDQQGNAVEGATVHLFQRDGSARPSRYRCFGPVLSDAGGAAHFEQLLKAEGRSDCWVHAHVESSLIGVTRRWVNPRFTEAKDGFLQVVMCPARVLRGQVTRIKNLADRPVRVRVVSMSVFDGVGHAKIGSPWTREESFAGLDTSLPELFETDVDEEGKFSLPAIPVSGRLTLLAEGAGLGQAQYGNLGKPIDGLVRMLMLPEAVIEGRVLREDGRPVPGVEVQARMGVSPSGSLVYLSTFRAITDEQGRYRLSGLPAAPYVLHATDPEGARVMMPLCPIEPRAGETLGGTKLLFQKGRVLQGRILDAQSGEPVEGAMLTALMGNRELRPLISGVSSDAQGRYTLQLPTGGPIELYFSNVPRGYTFPDPQIIAELPDIETLDDEELTRDFTLSARKGR